MMTERKKVSAMESERELMNEDFQKMLEEEKFVEVKYDRVEAYEKAAEQGEATAQYILGKAYHFGRGVVQDYGKAAHWYKKAAEQDVAAAQNNFGLCYANGYGVTQDHEKAVDWYEKAAEQGFAISQSNLGVCYRKGNGVAQDDEKAVY